MVLDDEFKQTLRNIAISSLEEKQKQVHDGMLRFSGKSTILADLAHKYKEIEKMISYVSKYQ